MFLQLAHKNKKFFTLILELREKELFAQFPKMNKKIIPFRLRLEKDHFCIFILQIILSNSI